MDESPGLSLSSARRLPRISNACVQCRSRHMKCSGTLPACFRCHSLDIECEYRKSRRGGRPRKQNDPTNISPTGENSQNPSATAGRPTSLVNAPFEATLASIASFSSTEPLSDADSNEGVREYLITSFYANFFASHPCTLPKDFYEQKRELSPFEFGFLDAVIQFVGSLFCPATPSVPLEIRVKSFVRSSFASRNAYDIQASILYATALYWRKDFEMARQLLDKAIDQALAIGLHMQSFATAHSDGNGSVLAECWRRTWWQLYITDAHMTAISHEPSFKTSQKVVHATVDLPCEEDEYCQGNIPMPRSLAEYDDREFADGDDDSFSSFAYLIALVRSFDETILGKQRTTSAESKTITTNADCAIKSWLMLLPSSKRRVISDDGVLDLHIFKAMVLIPVYVVDVHRALSTLEFDPIESVSSCSPPPPPEHLSAIYRRDAPTHTSKILSSIETMFEMLLLPSRITVHTPFMICMVSSTTIAYLSACKHVFRADQVAVARRRIKVAMGALKGFSEIWPGGESVLQEVKIIARKMLGMQNGATELGEMYSFGQRAVGTDPERDCHEEAPTVDLFSGLSLPDPRIEATSSLWSYLPDSIPNSLYACRPTPDQQTIIT